MPLLQARWTLAVSPHNLLYVFKECGEAHCYAAVKMQGFHALGSLSNPLLQHSTKKKSIQFCLITYTALRHICNRKINIPSVAADQFDVQQIKKHCGDMTEFGHFPSWFTLLTFLEIATIYAFWCSYCLLPSSKLLNQASTQLTGFFFF